MVSLILAVALAVNVPDNFIPECLSKHFIVRENSIGVISNSGVIFTDNFIKDIPIDPELSSILNYNQLIFKPMRTGDAVQIEAALQSMCLSVRSISVECPYMITLHSVEWEGLGTYGRTSRNVEALYLNIRQIASDSAESEIPGEYKTRRVNGVVKRFQMPSKKIWDHDCVIRN